VSHVVSYLCFFCLFRCRSGFATLPSKLLQEQPTVVLLWGMPLASWLLVMDEHSGLKNLRGSYRWSVIPHVHGRTELYCSSLYEPEPFLFSTPVKRCLLGPFIAQGRVVTMRPGVAPRWLKPYTTSMTLMARGS
jgi:hypothetical protein